MKTFTIPVLCSALAVVADATRLGSTSVEEFDVGADTVGAGAPELEVYDRLLDAPKARDGDDEHFQLLEGNNIFGDDNVDVGRDLQASITCQTWFFELETDNYAFETSWELKKSNGEVVFAGPPPGTKYRDNMYYSGSSCLVPGSYTLVLKDKPGDGLCCSYGTGYYRSTIVGIDDQIVEVGTDPGNENFSNRPHNFVVAVAQGGGTGRGQCVDVTIQLKVDEWPKETSYQLVSKDNGKVELTSQRENNAHQLIEKSACVPPGDYTFTITDDFGGIYQYNQRDGFYTIKVNNQLVINGDRFNSKLETHDIKVGYVPQMSSRDSSWLYAHNTGSSNNRRQHWHTSNGKPYVPLKWSTSLAADAKAWAETLVNNCNKTPYHASGVEHGENLAGNEGSGSWGYAPDPDDVLKRWVENEINDGWPDNAHLTQAMWRPTQYVGCGEAQRDLGGGQTCHRQVCRYVKAGNCEMEKGGWKDMLLQDESRCGPTCPDEGCYA